MEFNTAALLVTHCLMVQPACALKYSSMDLLAVVPLYLLYARPVLLPCLSLCKQHFRHFGPQVLEYLRSVAGLYPIEL